MWSVPPFPCGLEVSGAGPDGQALPQDAAPPAIVRALARGARRGVRSLSFPAAFGVWLRPSQRAARADRVRNGGMRDGVPWRIGETMHPLIENHRTAILALAAHHGVRNVRVFGSMARGDADDASDVDLLVSLPADKTGLALGGLLMDLRDLLKRRVEVVTESGLHPALRNRVLREAQPL